MTRLSVTGRPVLESVQHLQVRYAKRGRMRFASHRDIARAVERGVARPSIWSWRSPARASLRTCGPGWTPPFRTGLM
jgi:Uncharacterized protein conserved in bacteria (DUF2344)